MQGKALALFSLCLPWSMASWAVDAHSDALLDLSLEELGQVEVSVASLRTETVVSSPAVVSAYDMDEMAHLGLRTLRDVLNVIPGVTINSTGGGLNLVQIRGMGDGDNQKVLFLLNDVPYWMPASGDIPLLGIPYEGIERVEVIRGPGSVIYGTNASAGVIKVVTRTSDGARGTVTVGKDDLYNATAYAGTGIGEKGQLSVAVEGQASGADKQVINSFNPASFPPAADLNGTTPGDNDLGSLLLTLQQGGFDFMVQYHDQDRSDIFNGSLAQPSRYEQHGWLVSAAQTFDFDATELTVFSDLNRYYRDVDTDNPLVFYGISDTEGASQFANNGDQNQRWRSGVRVTHELTPNWSLLSGGEYEKRGTESQYYLDGNNGDDLRAVGFPVPVGEPGLVSLAENTAYEGAGYGQVDYHAGAWRVVVGGRYVNNSESGDGVTPRASVVYLLDNENSIKLLYAEGYNSPTFQQSSNVDFLGNPISSNISPETTRSTDLAFTHDSGRWFFVANAFTQDVSDLIVSAPGGGYTNSGSFNRWGAEIDSTYRHRAYELGGGVSYLHQGDERLGDDVAAWYAPKVVANLRGSLHLSERQLLGAVIHHLGERANVASAQWLDLNYEYGTPALTGFATVQNVLGENVRYPATDNFTDLVVRELSDLQWRVGVRAQF